MNATATIHLEAGTIDGVLDAFVARLDGQGYPVIATDLEQGTITVDSSSDSDEYSVLMAAGEAAIALDLEVEDVLFVSTPED